MPQKHHISPWRDTSHDQEMKVQMLGNVFWHRRNETAPRDVYEEKLTRFHQVLDESHLAGFKGAVVARIAEAPWFVENSEAYEEWYVLDGSNVIDELNEAAVSGARKEPHDQLARLAKDFRAGLYQLKMGPFTTVSGNTATWLSKPAGTTYQSFYSTLSEYLAVSKGSLWRRQMVLGPTTEFCVTAADRVDLPATFNPNAIRRNIIWRGRRLTDNNF